MSNEKISKESQNPTLRKDAVMPSLYQCMNCNHYNGLHDLLPKVKCKWKPTSDELRHRRIDENSVDCPLPYYGLNWA
jgi:hypothetical protein